MLSLYVVKKDDTKKNLPSNDSPIHDKHNGATVRVIINVQN